MVARFQSPPPFFFAWGHVLKQGAAAEELELAEAAGFFSFFQNFTDVALLSA
jgi:hypothetical protein